MAQESLFGSAVKQGFDAATEFARTDFAHSACIDSPELWGLEVSAGGNIGVGYYQGLEFSFEGGDINMNCLNQLELSPELEAGARVNLIRHFGDCHAEGENLEDTLFVELGAGVDTSLGLTLGVGVAYTAGLRKGLLNRALPDFVKGSYANWSSVIDAITMGMPVFDAPENPTDHDALCAETHGLFDGSEEGTFRGVREIHAAKLNGFLMSYIESNTHCEGTVADIVEHDDDEAAGDEHGHVDEDELHGWTVCSDLTLKNAVGFIRSRIAERHAAAEGVARKAALGQLDVTLGLLDDLFSGCDHIEFQFEAGVGVSTPGTVTLGLESHNRFGTLSFDGTDEELGLALEAALAGPDAFEDPTADSTFQNWALRTVCGAADKLPGFAAFALLPVGAICDLITTSRATLGFVETLRRDPRFEAHLTDSLELWGISLPLPDSPLLNYAATCSLGPMRNTLELLWYEP